MSDALALLAARAGDWPQSALHPAGPAAEAIASGWWLMAGAAVLVWAGVLALYFAAIRPSRRQARRGSGETLVVVGGIVVPTVLLSALLVYGSLSSGRITGSAETPQGTVQVVARRWQWEFTYLDARGQRLGRTIDRLVLPRGQWVEFRVTSEDVIHSFWIPRLGGKIDAIPGRMNTLRLRADHSVPMRGQCAEFCGVDHARMAFDVQVVEPGHLPAALAGQGGP